MTVSLPPLIADLEVVLDRPIAAMTTASLGDLRNLDLVHGRTLSGLNPLQLRTEAVDSSKIENISASLADYGRALLGSGANASAVSMASATRAMGRMISAADAARSISVESIVEAHRELFWHHPDEHERAGRIRSVQNWVGGSDYSPLGALHVPPPPETVPGYLADLAAFANREDLPILAQAAIVHAQFESIHPFIDGNGRIGRALLHAVLRRRRATRHLIVPIASALVINRERYFGALNDYRAGDPHPIVAMLASATNLATGESRRAADALVALRSEWQQRAENPRPGTATFRLLSLAAEEPILTIALAADRLRLSADVVAPAIEELVRVGLLTRAPRSRRTPVWLASDVLALLDTLRGEIQAASVRLQTRA